MDPHEAGPSIQTVLMRQPMHRSSLLWDAPLESEEAPGVLTCRHRNKVIERPRVKAKWLEDQFSNPLPADATEELVLQQYARFYILGMLGGTLFMDKSGERVSIMYLQFFNPISNGKKYSWGNAALSGLYRHLCNASKKTTKQIGGALLLVQLCAWVRFPHICPVMRHPHQVLPPGPLAIRWKGAKITTEHGMHVLRAYCLSLASLQPNQVDPTTGETKDDGVEDEY
ncbi:protein main-like 1 [Quercus suber]|uniref:Protein main-like 1 n=1 Tax=Quercus suber TaxID=58331 RepID=A0AAW0M6Y8_QUESU